MVTDVKIVESVRGSVVGSLFLKESLCGVIENIGTECTGS